MRIEHVLLGITILCLVLMFVRVHVVFEREDGSRSEFGKELDPPKDPVILFKWSSKRKNPPEDK